MADPAEDWADRFMKAQPVYRKKIQRFSRNRAALRLIPGYDQSDWENDLLEVLWRACCSYDPDKGASFNTYFWRMTNNHQISLHRKAASQKRVGDYERISLDEEEVREVISELRTDPSAEDEYLARITVRERFREGS